MIVKEQKPITFADRHGVSFDKKLLEEAMLWYADVFYASKPIASFKTITMHGKYPAVSIHQTKIHIHRLIYSYFHRHIYFANEYVHHKDGDKKNAQIKNLELMKDTHHQRITNKGRKQSAEHVAKRINATTKTRYGHSIYENPELLKV